jgi:hypothetical protein
VSEEPASALNTMISSRPAIRVRLAPSRLDTTPVTSIDRPITAMYEVNNSDTSEGEACSCSPMGLRMGSTRPMPMKAMTQAKETAQTALG